MTKDDKQRVRELAAAARRAELRAIIDNFEASSWLPYRRKLAKRLWALLDMVEDERDTWTRDSPKSLSDMLAHVQRHRLRGYPTVTVRPDMTFRAEW